MNLDEGVKHVGGMTADEFWSLSLNDVSLVILAFLELRDLGRLACVSKTLLAVTMQPQVWREICKKTFGADVIKDFRVSDWKQLCREGTLISAVQDRDLAAEGLEASSTDNNQSI